MTKLALARDDRIEPLPFNVNGFIDGNPLVRGIKQKGGCRQVKGNHMEPTATGVRVEKRTIFIELSDGRIIGFPADRFTIPARATDEELRQVTLRLIRKSRLPKVSIFT
ncbi:MAG: DUF2442 domain-containing protein [Desulfobulbaceae bacterium]|nr:DUF2442 domain-containing protein [Desulfobulbaceae bacterium]